MTSPATPPAAPPPVEPHRYQLWFEQFRDMAVMSLSLAGGGITLLGTIFADQHRPAPAFVAIFLFFVGAITALIAQTTVVSLADAGAEPGPRLVRLRKLSFACIGGGVGAFFTFILLALGR